MLSEIKNLIIDMDGVLWRGSTPMPGLAAFFQTLNALNINFVLATNNASSTPELYEGKLGNFGVTITANQVLTSAEATGDYLAQETVAGETAVYVAGDVGLHEAMRKRGFHMVTLDDALAGKTTDFVVVGFNRYMTYNDLAAATVLINKGARFIGTNPDLTFPSELGDLPGAGSFLALLQAATGVEPITIGKPGRLMFEQALHRLNSTPANSAMIGDRLNTDIAGAAAAGIHTILVLSGITQPEELETSAVQPDFVFADIGAITKALKSYR